MRMARFSHGTFRDRVPNRQLLICAVGVVNGGEYEIRQHRAPYLQAGGSPPLRAGQVAGLASTWIASFTCMLNPIFSPKLIP